MKYFFGTIVFALVAFGYYTFFYQPLAATSPTAMPVLTLGEIPNDVCPDKIWLLIVSTSSNDSLFDRVVPVRECRTVLLKNYLPSVAGEYSVYLKLPSSLSTSFIVNTPISQSTTVSMRLGDVTGDNAIDISDEKLVTDQLYAIGGSADITGDGKVSVDDVVTVRLNKGVGVERPDKRPWGKIE